MTHQELYELIDLPDAIWEGLEKVTPLMEKKLPELEEYLIALMDRSSMEKANRDLADKLGEDEGNFKMLYCHLECACRIHETYEQMGIPEQIFADTMGCFTRFAKECGVRNGTQYFDRGFWTFRQISMSLFRIGTLEYELCKIQERDVISIHIPSDAIMDDDKVDASLQQSRDFFARYFPEYPLEHYVCDSWLLAPRLRELLPDTSKILAFQRRFDIKEVDEKNMDCLEWLFKVKENTPYESLPEDTSLQRAAKKLLLSGKTIGAAYGELERQLEL